MTYLEPRVVLGLFNLGFSWVEIGSVTPKPQVSILVLHVPSLSKLDFWREWAIPDASLKYPVTLLKTCR